MKRKMRRFLAMALAVTMVLQQGSTLGVLAVETEPMTEAAALTAAETQSSESETKAPEIETKAGAEASEIDANTQETKAETKETAAETKASESETKAPETKASESETKAPETKAETKETKAETQASESETKAPETKSSESETKAETQTSESGTKETELKTQTDETTTESESNPGAAETASEKTTESELAEQPVETESELETATELVTEELTEAETETETEEPVVLEAVVTQEVFQKTVEDATIPMVKYTVKVANKAAKTEAEGVSLKVLLADAVSYKKEEGETLELVSFESLGKAIESATFENEELTEADKAAYANGGVVLWKDQKIAAGEEKTFVFFAEVKDGQTDTNALRNRWIVNGKAVAEDKVQWMNTELLEVKKELPSEFVYEDDNMIVTATLAEGTILPEGAKLVVTEEELPDEYRALVGETLDDEQILAGYVYYDMHFEVDGQEIEPENGTVAVSVAYKTPLQLSESADETAQEDTEYKVLHLTDEQTVEEVTDNVAATDDGQVNEMGFTTDSFSGFMLIGTNDAITEKEITAKVTCPGAPEGTQFDFVFYIEGDETNSKQRLKSKDGEINFTIKSDSLMNAKETEESSSNEKIEYYTGVLKQLPRATVDKVTFDEVEWTVKIAKKIDKTTGSSSLETVSFYKKDSTEAAEKIEFNNTYQRAYFNRYSMAGLLNGYNVIAFSDATLGNHTVGGVLVGGELKSSTSNTFGESALLGGEYPVPSYVAGKVTTNFTYGGEGGFNTKGPLYVGAANQVSIEYEQGSDSYTYKWSHDGMTGQTKQNGAPVYAVDYPYVNFDTVRSVFTGTMDHYAGEATTCSPQDGKYTVAAGTNEKIEGDISNLIVNITGYNNSGMDENTYITVTTGGRVVVNCEFNGGGTATGDTSSNDVSSIIWYFPNATEVLLNSTPWYGHVIAPKAELTIEGGNYAGTLVGNTVIAKGEGHCYPYRGNTGFNLGLGFDAKKTLVDSDGNSVELQAEEFEFTLTPASSNVNDPITGVITAKNDASGKVSFGTFVYTKAGTYTYTVKESAGTESGIEYDGAEYTVTVEVTERAGNELVADVQIVKKADGTETTEKEIAFKNEKTKGSASAELKVKKEYNDTFPTKEGEKFEFVLTAGTARGKGGNGISTPMPAGSEGGSKRVTVTDTNEKTFGKITYTEDGTYYYTITETKGSLKDVTYDPKVYEIEVTVDSKADGMKNATVKSRVKAENGKESATYEGSGNIFTATFKNVHKTEEAGTTELKVQKNFTEDGTAIDFPAEGFTFELATTTGAPMPTGSSKDGKKTVTVKNLTAMGFGEIKYTTNGTYTYTIREVIPTDAEKVGDKFVKDGITYDVTVYTVTVDVKSKTDGMGKDITVSSDPKFTTDKTATFTNTYKATTSISVEKVWVDGNNKDGLRPDSIQVQLQKNGETEGKAVTLNEENKWSYTWKDLPKRENGKEIAYTVEEVGTVTGYTSASKTTGTKTTITNTHVLYTDIVLGATKVFDRTLTGDDFTFRLEELNADGTVKMGGVSLTAKNKADGEISFAAIPYKKAGTYYYQISEVIPTGEEKDASVLYDATVKKVTVMVTEKDGKLVAVSNVEAKDAVFTNRITSVKVSKTDVVTGEELEGAHIQILDKEGNVVEEWDSTKEAHEVKGLKTGETYTLKETVAPDGYTVTAETTFTLKEDGTVDSGAMTTTVKDGVLLVEDSFNKVSILKVDESGTALAGAKLVVKDKDGKAVGEPWKTDGKAHDITGLAKGSYTLSEIEAPEGYQVSADIPFEITGKEAAGQVITVEMKDAKIPKTDKRSLTVTKRLRLDGITSDVGIKDAVYYVALFSDEAKTQRVSDVKPVVFKNSTASSVTFENLAKGTYYVGETDENGTLLLSKMVNDKVIFYPEYDATAKVEFEGGRSETASAEFTNVYVELTSGLYLSGQLTVTKKVLLNGAEGTSDETYYARVFFDKAMTSPASDVLALNLAGGTSASVTVTDLYIGETIGSSATYYVAETDKDGTPLDPDTVTEFEISIDKSEIVMDANNSVQEVVITNSYTEEETETETETEVDEKKTAPKTGDDTDFMRYLLLMALSAGTCAAAFDRKRRKARRVEK